MISSSADLVVAGALPSQSHMVLQILTRLLCAVRCAKVLTSRKLFEIQDLYFRQECVTPGGKFGPLS
jgi:hypothetical protein